MKKVVIFSFFILIVLGIVLVFFSKKDIPLFISFCSVKNEFQKITKYIGYEKTNTMTITQFLYDEDPNHWEMLSINKKGDVEYKNKVILNSEQLPLNDCSAYTDNELIILFQAKGIKPREGCNPNDKINNGTLGCYIDNPDS